MYNVNLKSAKKSECSQSEQTTLKILAHKRKCQ